MRTRKEIGDRSTDLFSLEDMAQRDYIHRGLLPVEHSHRTGIHRAVNLVGNRQVRTYWGPRIICE
jgi:hypothetical protein